MDREQGKSEPLVDPRKSLEWAVAIVAMMAAAYQNLFFAPTSMGCWAIGVHTILGVLCAIPLFVAYMPPVDELGARLAALLWFASMGLMVLRGLVNRRPRNPHSPYEIGTMMFGRLGILMPLGLGLFALPHCPGITCFLFWGFVANRIHHVMIRARHRRQIKHLIAARAEAEMVRRYLDRAGL